MCIRIITVDHAALLRCCSNCMYVYSILQGLAQPDAPAAEASWSPF